MPSAFFPNFGRTDTQPCWRVQYLPAISSRTRRHVGPRDLGGMGKTGKGNDGRPWIHVNNGAVTLLHTLVSVAHGVARSPVISSGLIGLDLSARARNRSRVCLREVLRTRDNALGGGRRSTRAGTRVPNCLRVVLRTRGIDLKVGQSLDLELRLIPTGPEDPSTSN